jgi:hypothetical protein
MNKALLCGLAATLIACSSGGASSPDASGGSGGAGGTGGASGYFITAEVDGVTMRAETNVRAYWFQGLQPGYLGLTASGSGWSWELVMVNMTGTPACGTASVQLNYDDTSMGSYGTFHAGDACAFTVSSAAPAVGDVLEGTFSAMMSGMPTTNPDRVATNGSFRVPRVADEPPAN